MILVSAIKPSGIQRAITKVQLRGGYEQEDAQWQHAAVYIGRDSLCEANRHGVKVEPIWQYIGGHRIRVRRDNALDDEARWHIVVNALTMKGYRYSYPSIIKLWWQSYAGFYRSTIKPESISSRARICSHLYADAYTKATKKVIYAGEDSPPTPACLSFCKTFEDVPTYWVGIKKGN